MKIGIVCYPTFGGSGVLATELGLSLARRGNQIHFISYAQPMRLGTFHENIVFHAVEIPHYPLFEFHLYTLALAGKIIDVAKYEELDILHVHYAIPHAVSGFLSRDILGKNNLKLVTTLHGTDITLVGLEPSFLPIVRYALERSDSITAVSMHLREKTLQNFTCRRDIEVIPNFVDTEQYKRNTNGAIKQKLAPNNEKIIAHISNFRKVKRVTDVVRVFKEISDKIDAKLLMIGDGPEASQAENLCREFGLCSKVRFLGQQSGLPEILSAVDLFLLPSQSESFGLSALEAMSCGVPVIASNIGGIPEVVVHGETGYVAEMGDTERMGRYAVELLTNEKKWNAFSEGSRRRAVETFDIHKIVPMYEDLYRRVLE